MHPTERSFWERKASHRTARRGFRGHLARGLHLTRASLRMVSNDPHLLVLPFLAIVMTGFVWLLVFVSVWALGLPPWSPSSGFLYQEVFAAYLITYFVSVYFMTAMIAATQARLRGERPTVGEGVAEANRCLLRLVAWALVASTIGVLFRLLSLRWESMGRAVARFLGYPWPIATIFVLPSMVVEGLGPVKAMHRSRTLMHRTWGPRQSGILGTGVVFSILFLVGFVPLVAGLLDPAGTGWIAIAVLYWLVLTALWSLVDGILVTALYHYATASEAPFGFSWQALNHPWVR